MADTMFLKQAEGRTVPQEDGKPWPEDGMDVAVTRYIRRRLRDGDLIKATRPKKAADKPAEKQTSSGGKS